MWLHYKVCSRVSHYVNEIPFNMIAPAPFPCLSFIANVSRHLALIDIEFVCYASAVKKKENVEKVGNVASGAFYFNFFFWKFTKNIWKIIIKIRICMYLWEIRRCKNEQNTITCKNIRNIQNEVLVITFWNKSLYRFHFFSYNV